MIKQRKEQTKNLEKKMIRFNGLEREYQKKNIDINNNNILVLKNKPKNKMVMVFFIIQMEMYIKVIGKIIEQMEKVFT